MDYKHLPQLSFVYDTARVPWVKRFALKTLDILAWSAWLLLWLPLLTGLIALFSGQSHIDPVLINFGKVLGFGALFLVIMWLLFMTWSAVRDIGLSHLRNTLNRTKSALHIGQLAKVFALQEDTLRDWQKSQIMLAHHSEDTGWLQHIDPLPHIIGRAYDPAEYAIIIKPH